MRSPASEISLTYELRLRINQLLAEFGSRSVESIKKSDIVGWMAEQATVEARG